MEENSFISKLEELLIKSEERIDRTNDMVCKCVNVVNQLTQEYSTHINKLQESRDEILKQNGALLQHIQNLQKEIDNGNKRFDSVLNRLFSMGNNSENNITVK